LTLDRVVFVLVVWYYGNSRTKVPYPLILAFNEHESNVNVLRPIERILEITTQKQTRAKPAPKKTLAHARAW